MRDRYLRTKPGRTQPLLIILAGPDEVGIKAWNAQNYPVILNDPHRCIRMVLELQDIEQTTDKIETYFRNGVETIILTAFHAGPGVVVQFEHFADLHPDWMVEWRAFQLSDETFDGPIPTRSIWVCPEVRRK